MPGSGVPPLTPPPPDGFTLASRFGVVAFWPCSEMTGARLAQELSAGRTELHQRMVEQAIMELIMTRLVDALSAKKLAAAKNTTQCRKLGVHLPGLISGSLCRILASVALRMAPDEYVLRWLVSWGFGGQRWGRPQRCLDVRHRARFRAIVATRCAITAEHAGARRCSHRSPQHAAGGYRSTRPSECSDPVRSDEAPPCSLIEVLV